MTDETPAVAEDNSPPTPAPEGGGGDSKKVLKTALFVGMLVAVLGVFQALNVLADPPPDMPKDPPHTLILNLQNDLVGVGDPATWPTHDAEGKEYPKDKKAIERRVNYSCTACHGAPAGLRDEEFSKQVACAVPTKCLPNVERHPQKTTCIKCHRMPGRAKN